MISLEQLKGRYFLHQNSDYIIASGAKLCAFKTDGTLVACRRDLPNVYKHALLPNNCLLTGISKGAYHLISLDDGAEIYAMKRRPHEYTIPRFAISCSREYVYDFYTYRNMDYLVSIDVKKGKICEYPLKEGLRATTDIICDEQGEPCLLQHHIENVGVTHISQNGVRCQRVDAFPLEDTSEWKYRWTQQESRLSACFLGNSETILTYDLHVYYPKTGLYEDLLENEHRFLMPQGTFGNAWLDGSGRYIILRYPTANIIIDWSLRKVVACYAADFCEGCLVGNEFWISSNNGIVRKPFPLIEQIPSARLTTM